jgi:hypothetical protein
MKQLLILLLLIPVLVFAEATHFTDLTVDDDLIVVDDVTIGGSTAFTGAVSFSGVLSIPDGTALLPSLTNTGDTNTGLWFSAADKLNASVAGVEVLEFGTTANSIGNASDTTTLLGAFRVGTGGTPGITLGDDDIYVEGTAEVDGVMSVSAGAVAAPAIYGTDDVNTGIWWSAADTFNASVAGVEVL